MRLFLISGKAGSGKDEVASIIKNHLDKTVITSFSKYIKLFAREVTDWDGTDTNKPREFLQNVGDLLRAADIDYMTRRIKEDMQIYEKLDICNVIVSDVRLLNELEYFKKMKDIDVVTIRVNSNESKRKLTDMEKLHHTETELDQYKEFDYIIDNKFDESLEENVLEILEGMK